VAPVQQPRAVPVNLAGASSPVQSVELSASQIAIPPFIHSTPVAGFPTSRGNGTSSSELGPRELQGQNFTVVDENHTILGNLTNAAFFGPKTTLSGFLRSYPASERNCSCFEGEIELWVVLSTTKQASTGCLKVLFPDGIFVL